MNLVARNAVPREVSECVELRVITSKLILIWHIGMMRVGEFSHIGWMMVPDIIGVVFILRVDMVFTHQNQKLFRFAVVIKLF